MSLGADLDEAQNRIDLALDVAQAYGQIDGDHHKAWVIDEMVRALTGSGYQQWVERFEQPQADEDGDLFHDEWNVGIAP